MLIWLVEFKAILRKANFILTLCKTSFQINETFMAWKPPSQLLLFTLQILLEKLECWDPLLTSLFSCSELSVAGDTAMIIVLHSREVVTLSPLDFINPFCSWPSWSEKERWRWRRDLWETVPCSSGQTHTRGSSAEICRNQVPRTYLVKAEP